MDKYIYDESNGLWYELQGDYYIPCITLPTEKEHKFIGLWGQRYKRYLQEHKRAVYTTLLTSGKLNGYLADIDEQAMDMMFRLVEQMADKEGVTEQLKAENPMLWVVRMNEIQARAREIINREIILYFYHQISHMTELCHINIKCRLGWHILFPNKVLQKIFCLCHNPTEQIRKPAFAFN